MAFDFNTTAPASPLRAVLAQCVASAWITERQADAIASCVEVEYDGGCPEEIAAALMPLMGINAKGDPTEALWGKTMATAEPPVPQWKAEFPDFGDELGITIPHGWEDSSWHNDVCPSFSYDVYKGMGCDEMQQYRVFVDYAAQGRRELPGPRFRLALFDEDGAVCLRDSYETDDARAMSAMLALIALRDEVLDWQAALAGEREDLDELCASCDAVIDGEVK